MTTQDDIFEAKEMASAMREWAGRKTTQAGSTHMLLEGAKSIDRLVSIVEGERVRSKVFK